MIVTWQLTSHAGRRISLIVSIDAGEFASREITVKELMDPGLPPESPIRLSHFAYTEARQADLKVVFRSIRYPSVWAAENFWSFPYFKNAPMLMPKTPGRPSENDVLPVTDSAIRDFREALFLKDEKDYGILPVVHSFPPKVLAALEVAHVTTLRRLHHEAIQLLSTVLSFEPLNHIARTLRLHNFMALGSSCRDPDASNVLFDRAEHEGRFIDTHCTPDAEFYSEFSLVQWSRAVRLMKFMRKRIIKDTDETKSRIIELLASGEEWAKKGLAVSTTGADSRCGYWLLYCLAFRRLLEKDPDLMADISRPVEDRHDLFPAIFASFANVAGWMPDMDNSGTKDEEYMAKRALRSSNIYLNSLSSTYQHPHAAFGVCNFLWDFSDASRKQLLIDHILLSMEVIRMKIEELKPICLGTYSATPTLIEVQSPREYIECIDKTRQEVLKVKETGNYHTGMKILLLNFDSETNTAPITFDLIQKEG